MSDAHPKICVDCREDCASRPRVRNDKGQYLCAQCQEARRARKTHDVAPAPDDELDPIPLADPIYEDEPAAEPAAASVAMSAAGAVASSTEPDDVGVAPEDPAIERGRCPVCMRSLAARVCVACGFDPALGLVSSRLVAKTQSGSEDGKPRVLCRSCGYDLSGNSLMRCTECGTPVTMKRGNIVQAGREDLRRQLIMFGVWISVSVIGFVTLTLLFVSFTIMPTRLEYFLQYAGRFAIGYAVAMLFYYMACFFWMGSDAPFWLNLYRMLTVFTVVSFVSLIASLFVPFFFAAVIIGAIVHLTLFQQVFELDFEDAAIVGLLTYLPRAILFFTYGW